MNNCIFCKIASGEIPSNTIYEDKEFRVILDISPATKGHCLILPKSHAKDLYELPDELVAKVMLLSKKIASKLQKAFHCDGLNIVQNNGAVAGQTVFHYHLHIIPRYEADNQNISWTPTTSSKEELLKMENEVKQF